LQKNEHLLSLRSLSVALGLIALTLGLLASVAVLRGDDFGRVNLLYSLSLFTLLPSIGLVVTLLLLFLGRRNGIAALLIELPLAPKKTYLIASHPTKRRAPSNGTFLTQPKPYAVICDGQSRGLCTDAFSN